MKIKRVKRERFNGNGDYLRICAFKGKCIHGTSVNKPCIWCYRNIPF